MRFIVKFSPVLAALLLAMACGDDDDAGPSTSAKCKSPYADQTAEKLEDRTNPSGACAEDTAAVCANDVITETSNCATGCFAMHPNDPQMAGACTLGCLHGTLKPAPSDTCLNCYLVSVNCTATNCFNQCITGGAAAPACTQCRAEKGCTAAFYACSGLPLPTGTTLTPNGGAGGNGGAGEPTAGAPTGMGGSGGMAGAGEAGMSNVAGSGATSGGGPLGGAGGNAGAGG